MTHQSAHLLWLACGTGHERREALDHILIVGWLGNVGGDVKKRHVFCFFLLLSQLTQKKKKILQSGGEVEIGV